MGNKIKAGILGLAMLAIPVVASTSAEAATTQQVSVKAAAVQQVQVKQAARPYCSPVAQGSGYAEFFWWLIGGRC